MNLKMLWPNYVQARQGVRFVTVALLVITNFVAYLPPANALITGGTGKQAVSDPGWPQGAAHLFNSDARIAWWEGPPFGGGQYTAECRGDTKVFNAVLLKFAKLNVKEKQLIVYDGTGNSFWLNPNREPDKQVAARIDWTFMVWVSGKWEDQHKLPAELKSSNPADAEQGPPAAIELYTGGSIRWSEVKVPPGVKVIDKRQNNSSASE